MPFHRSTTSDTACGRKAQRPKGFGGEGPSAVCSAPTARRAASVPSRSRLLGASRFRQGSTDPQPLLARWRGIDFVAAPSIRPLGARNATAQTRDADSYYRRLSRTRASSDSLSVTRRGGSESR